MGSLKVVTSHSLSRLVAALSADLTCTPASVFERETVVVLNTGMARWISMELAALQGVSAGLDFRFPNEPHHPQLLSRIPRRVRGAGG